jgi:hypothetical protein
MFRTNHDLDKTRKRLIKHFLNTFKIDANIKIIYSMIIKAPTKAGRMQH